MPDFAASFSGRRAPLEIGLLNNMPDAALHATERQFAGLLRAAAGQNEVRLHFFSLPEVPRGEYTRTYMRGVYADSDSLFDANLDALIVTGAEPRAARLEDEPYWASLARVIDWAKDHPAASLWSCLAAHAAVQHLDGVRRQPLETKCSGVFASEKVAQGDPLLAHWPTAARTPHSRLNELDEAELAARGYTILTRSPGAGVDTFARRGQSLMVFCQGHPEYDADTLLREYGRDMSRYQRGERETLPGLPTGYLDQKTARAFETLAKRAPDPERLTRLNAIAARATPRQTWRPTTLALYRDWLHHIAAEKAKATRAAFKARAAAVRRARG